MNAMRKGTNVPDDGGSVEVLEVGDGMCSLEFSGPVALAQSIASSIKGKFPLIRECKIKQV